MGLRVTALLIALCLVGTGCGVFSGTKDATEDLIWSDEVELEQECGLGPAGKKMAGIVYPVDTRLESLIQAARTLEPSNQGELSNLVSKFPWIEGAALVSPDAEMRLQRPEKGQMQLALEKVVQRASQWRDRRLHAVYGKQLFGADVVVLKPLYTDGVHKGYLVVSFDFRSLADYSSRSEELIAVSGNYVLWPGRYVTASESLASTEWDALLEDGVSGRHTVRDRGFLWMARYIGREPFFYAVEIQQGT